MLVLTLSGCNTAASDYRHVLSIDSVRVYEDFLEHHPNSEFKVAAQSRLQELRDKQEHMAWKKASESNSPYSYRVFLRKYKNSRFAEKARHALERLKYDEALAARGESLLDSRGIVRGGF